MNNSIDIIRYLDDRDIHYHSTGKNISIGWVGISCPFCFDTSTHLGIHKTKGSFSCWICGKKGSFFQLIRKIDKCSYIEAKKIFNEYSQGITLSYEEDTYEIDKEMKWPKELTKDFPPIVYQYFKKRRLNFNIIKEKYDLYWGGYSGYFKYMVVTPIKINSKVVNLVGRDVTLKNKLKYKNNPNSESIIPIKNLLYNIDSIKDIILIVEGIFDVFRIGEGAVATFGTEFTENQLELLVKHSIKKAYIMFDSEEAAIKKAYKLGNKLSIIVPYIEVIELDIGDPCNMSQREINKLKEEIFN